MMAIRLFTGFKTKLLFVIIVMSFSCTVVIASINNAYPVRSVKFNAFVTGYGLSNLDGISVTGTLNPFQTCAGTSSASQFVTVSGDDLTQNILVTAPAGFEISTLPGSGYGTTITLPTNGGKVYIRIAAGSTGSLTGSISFVSAPFPTISRIVSGTVNALPTIVSATGAARTGPGSLTNLGTVSPPLVTTIDWFANPTGGVALTTGTLSYTTGIISSTTNYYAEARNTLTGCISSARTMVTDTINPVLNPGSIGVNQSFCVGQNPAPLNSIVLASGGTGSISYQWQSSTDNIVFTDIIGATLINYTPVAPTQTTYYRRKAITAADGSIASNTVTITVNPKPVVNFN
ncbi:MAG: hypothetical protein K2Q21_03635 [Chitinophagaceae bacterium]|nr:hypothetical protein [Chitinophagaceae bacterium]